MARTNYANGDEISLGNCNGCNPVCINGVLCHETGCPEEWRDRLRDCFECGCDFLPEHRHQSICSDCLQPDYLAEEFAEEFDELEDDTGDE